MSLERALELAAAAPGRAYPNPTVGAVVVADGEIVGEGVTEEHGGRHGEVVALDEAGDRARGATLYLTMEPCTHHGRTPPCVDRVLAAGIARVVAGSLDPNPEAGGGLERLREAGVEVELADSPEARRQNEAWRTWVALGRPFVTYKAAVTLDGRVTVPGSRWVTGEESRRRVHELRAASDAVAVGMGTFRADAPRLDARDVPVTRQPRRLVFGRGPLPPDSELELVTGPLDEAAAHGSAGRACSRSCSRAARRSRPRSCAPTSSTGCSCSWRRRSRAPGRAGSASFRTAWSSTTCGRSVSAPTCSSRPPCAKASLVCVFTGIVQALGRVRSFEDGRLVVERGPVDAAIGDSVAVNGVCLTVVERGEETLAFDVVPETVSRTRPFGDAVNLEPPLRAGDPFGGHVVQGHVDGVGRIRDVDDGGDLGRPAGGAAPLRRREGVDRRRRRLAHDRGARRRRLPDRADPAYARGDDARRARAGRRGQPRGRRAGEIRRAARANPLSTMSRVTTETRVFAPIEDAIEDIRQGKFVVVVDDEDRENEGDLTIAAQFATPEAVNFMATHARGLICLCLTEERCDELGLPPMTEHNEAPLGTAFTVTIEAREGVTTGISAHDRSRTIQVAIDPVEGRRTTSSGPDTSSRSARGAAASSSASGRPRRRSTWRGSRACSLPASSARS